MRRKIESVSVISYILVITFTLICLYPVWYVLVISFSTFEGYFSDPYHIIPRSFTVQNYLDVIKDGAILKGFWVSTRVTVLGTMLSMVLTCMAGYAFSKRKLPGLSVLYKIVLVTMYFSGGIVPMYLLISGLGLKNSVLALILPISVNTFYIIIAQNFFSSLPPSLEESAKIDGASDSMVLLKIVIPMSRPIVATLTLFYTVGYWNDYLLSVYYISDKNLFPVQLVIRSMISGFKFNTELRGTVGASNTNGLIMTCVVIALIPIIMIYPFLQKYFTKGVMIGAIKE